ncbi:hypothetical protein ACFQVA_09710 [Actinomadura keratinilytica]
MTKDHDDGRPDPAHRRPEPMSDTAVEALGALSKALETTERARGHLYSFHQLTGTADFQLDEAVRLLREAATPRRRSGSARNWWGATSPRGTGRSS